MTAVAPTAPHRGDILRPQARTEAYATDLLSLRSTLLGITSAGVGGFFLTITAWLVMKQTSLPAFNTSMVTRGLATVGIVATLGITAALLGWWLMDEYRATRGRVRRPAWRTALTYVFAYLSPAMLTIAALGIPLSATRLWLDGIQVDQVFRTQFLTRTTEQGGYADMNYFGLPTFYPLGWFWLGGRLAAVLGLPGWEVYQPWALASLAVAGCILVPVWQHLCGSLPVATAIAFATTAVTLTIAAEEPYSAVIAMGVPAVAVMCARAFSGSWASTVAIMLFLGISASFYTLYTGVISLTVTTLVALVMAAYNRSWMPIVRLVIIAVGSLSIAAVSWGPYVLQVLRSNAPLESTAQHYLPDEGTQLPVPFLAPSVIGLLCLVGLVFLILRVSDPDVRTLLWALGGVYGWIIASMVMTLVGTTLLGFRLELVVVVILVTAGVLGFAELRLMGVHTLYPARFDIPTNRVITWAFIAVLLLSSVAYAQQIPARNESAIDHAYSDTDGYGERADRFPSNSGQYYAEMNDFIREHGNAPTETVIMTDEKLFMAYYPYHGFNAFTSHYANPLGQFSERNRVMEEWATKSWHATPEEFRAALDDAPWKAPDAIIFRGSLPQSLKKTAESASGTADAANGGAQEKSDSDTEGLKIHLAEDIFPNQPNVRYRAIFYDPEVFQEGWALKQVGPFVVAVRTN